ncbi:hypothetical protein AB0M54_45855 [Actinoplanes sp. NPDC051470]|uniref:hypothetical protein n=1 Tax=Actinoplanes sp. NPDC051470 TaxID=3157224 RepID=UPI003439CA08
MLTVTDVERALENHEFVSEGVWDFGRHKGEAYRYVHSGFTHWDEYVPGKVGQESEPVKVDGVGDVRVLHTYTGGEDGGADAELIFKVTPDLGGVRYFRKSGWYSSYNGTDWDGQFTEVQPKVKTVTVFE